MEALSNPYVLLLFVALAVGYEITEKVKEPVKKAYHQVEHVAKKVEHGIVHVVTFGHK